MPEPLSPGQAAYAAWWRTRYGMQQADEISAYQMLPPSDRRAWDAAAQAVLALKTEEGGQLGTRDCDV